MYTKPIRRWTKHVRERQSQRAKEGKSCMGDGGLWEHVSSRARVSSINHPQSATHWSEPLILYLGF